MTVPYDVQVITAPGDKRYEALERSLDDAITAHGLQLNVEIRCTPSEPENDPSVVAFFGGADAAADDDCQVLTQAALDAGRTVIPVVTAVERAQAELPPSLGPYNAWVWGGDKPSDGLARLVLEELGIEEGQRRAFISHRREDGLLMAEQLHDELSHRRFRPFIDRFAIPPGRAVQGAIADALENFAFILFLESPLAAGSDWVFYEVEYALSHAMGVCIVRWPGDVPELPGTQGMPRLQLAEDDIIQEHGLDVLTQEAIGRVSLEVERAHAAGLVRRRKNLVVSISDAARGAGRTVLELTGWRLLVHNAGANPAIVGVAPRLPVVEDLFKLDSTAEQLLGAGSDSVLVHAARQLQPERRELLTWASGARSIRVVPENAIGGFW